MFGRPIPLCAAVRCFVSVNYKFPAAQGADRELKSYFFYDANPEDITLNVVAQFKVLHIYNTE